AVVVNRLAGEATVERLHLKSGDFEEPKPLVPGSPPERTRRAAVEDDIDPVVAYCITDGVWHGLCLVRTVEMHGDVVIERKGVPGEPPVLSEQGSNTLEGAAAIGPGWQVQER